MNQCPHCGFRLQGQVSITAVVGCDNCKASWTGVDYSPFQTQNPEKMNHEVRNHCLGFRE